VGYSEQLPSGNWRAVAKVADVTGKVRRVGCGTHDSEWEADLAWQERERGTEGAEPDAAVLSLSRYADGWAERKRGGWAASTRGSYLSVVRFLRTDPLGRLDINEIIKADLDRAITRWDDAGTGAAVIGLRFRTVRAVLHDAVDNEARLRPAPTKGMTLPTQAEDTRRGQPIDADDVTRLLDAAREVDPRWHAFLLVAHEAGLRFGEIAALRPRDIADGEIKVRRSLSRDGSVRSYTKGRTKRDVPTTARLERALRPLLAAARLRGSEDALLFVRPDTERPVLYDHWRDVMGSIRQGAGLRRSGITLHDFRHTFITNARNCGVPVDVVRRWAGHSSEVVTNGYSHGPDAALNRAWLRFAVGEGPSPATIVE